MTKNMKFVPFLKVCCAYVYVCVYKWFVSDLAGESSFGVDAKHEPFEICPSSHGVLCVCVCVR